MSKKAKAWFFQVHRANPACCITFYQQPECDPGSSPRQRRESATPLPDRSQAGKRDQQSTNFPQSHQQNLLCAHTSAAEKLPSSLPRDTSLSLKKESPATLQDDGHNHQCTPVFHFARCIQTCAWHP